MLDDANATPVLTSFGDGFKTLIFGAMGAIGGAFSDVVGQKNAGPLVTTSRSVFCRKRATLCMRRFR